MKNNINTIRKNTLQAMGAKRSHKKDNNGSSKEEIVKGKKREEIVKHQVSVIYMEY